MRSSSDNSVKSVKKALSILNCFDIENDEISLPFIVEKVGLPKTTVFRILSTLENEGFLEKCKNGSRYRLGHSVYLLGLIARDSLKIRTVSIPYMEDLNKNTNETCNLYMLDNYERVCIAQILTKIPRREFSKLGERFPIWSGGTGRVILSQLDESFWYEISNDLKQFTKNTLAKPEEFITDLKEIREKGYSISTGEIFSETVCISAPIFDNSGVVGCLSITAPIYRFPKNKNEYIELIVESSKSISHELGFIELNKV